MISVFVHLAFSKVSPPVARTACLMGLSIPFLYIPQFWALTKWVSERGAETSPSPAIIFLIGRCKQRPSPACGRYLTKWQAQTVSWTVRS